jgi:hypothetical protein
MRKAQFQMKEKFYYRGEFDVFSLKDNKLLYSDHNQVQTAGAKTIAKLLCLGQFGREKPVFSNIKASISNETAQGVDTILLPGEFTSNVVEASRFYTSIESNPNKEQNIDCYGEFLTVPPSYLITESGTYTSEPFYHFGLYLSSMSDIEEYLFAYKYIEKGIIYPEGFGIRIRWRLRFL